MTTSEPEPPLAPDELVSTGGEHEVLETFLDLYREIIQRKVTGLSEEQLRRRLVPSATTLAGLLKHLTGVEREWFQLGWPSVPPGSSAVSRKTTAGR